MKQFNLIICSLIMLTAACTKDNVNINQSETIQKTETMPKIIHTYGGKTIAQIKSIADCPAQADMIIVGSTVECSNLNTTQIKNALGSSSTAVAVLCKSANVNKWSFYGPYVMSRDMNGEAINTLKTPYSLGCFAGYNHEALPPVYFLPFLTNLNGKKNVSYDINFGFTLNPGDRYPDDDNSHVYYTRVKAVITDITNFRTITGYSNIIAAPQVGITHPTLTVNDDTNVGISGNAKITAEYCSIDGLVIYGQVEGKHPDITVNITPYTVLLAASDFPVSPTWDEQRIYYGSGVGNYLPATWSKYLHIAHQELGQEIWLNNQLNGSVIPAVHGGENFAGFMIIKKGSIYYRYNVAEYTPGQLIDSIHEIPPSMAYIYKLNFAGTVAGWL